MKTFNLSNDLKHGAFIEYANLLMKNAKFLMDYPHHLKLFIDTGQRKIDKWYNQCDLELVDFSDDKNIFININSREDLIEYKKLINESIK